MQTRKYCLAISLVLLTWVGPVVLGHVRARTPVRIPDIPGFKTLKCDFHIHTVFSDGSVWPDIRSEEAWREGLDAIAITDHIEYQPHLADLPTNHNRPHQIAKPRGDELQVLVIRGSEITRRMPPGHLNAIFLEDCKPLDTPEWRDAVKEAHKQGAFIFWNHPGWEGQQPDRVAKWYPEHSELVENGMLHGIEVANDREYYPEAHRWCLEKNLTMLSNSDIHNPIHLDYDVHTEDHRPMTLVFARENTPESIKEALFDRRTAVYTGNRLIGREQFVRPLFTESIRLRNPDIRIKGRQRVYLQIHNTSDLNYELELAQDVPDLTVARQLKLPSNRTALLELRGVSESLTDKRAVELAYRVKNILVAPDEPLQVDLPITVEFLGKP